MREREEDEGEREGLIVELSKGEELDYGVDEGNRREGKGKVGGGEEGRGGGNRGIKGRG